jgi:hypothetical protein
MSYAQARWAGVRQALLPWLKRVALVLGLALAISASGSGDPLTVLHVMAATATWSVMPLQHLGWSAAPVQALLVTGLLFALRGLLQPAAWLELERSWPLSPASLRQTDALLCLFALLPPLVLQTIGLVMLQLPLLALQWLAGTALGLGLSLLAMQARRRGPRPLWRPPAPSTGRLSLAPLSPLMALVALPLLRGPLRRSGALLLGQALLLAAWPGLLFTGLSPAILAMAWVALAWLGLQRANAWLDADMQPLLAALPPLPLDVCALQRRLRLLALLPWLLALPAVLVLLVAASQTLRPGVAVALPLLLGALGSWAALTRLAADDQHAVRVLLGLALPVALASELFA